MAEISIVGPADGETALSGPATVRIIEDGGTTSHRLGMAEIVLAPHTTGPPQHRHERHDEGFYVVSGTVRFTSGEKSFDAPPRALVMVPPGAPRHRARHGRGRLTRSWMGREAAGRSHEHGRGRHEPGGRAVQLAGLAAVG
jgi:mannose-6-phosphate isomerase-like protein (cupin superfamily)